MVIRILDENTDPQGGKVYEIMVFIILHMQGKPILYRSVKISHIDI